MTARDVGCTTAATRGWVTVLLVAVVAFGALSLSEHVAALRTDAARASGPAGAKGAAARSWRRARLAAPAGDPRRVLARADAVRSQTAQDTSTGSETHSGLTEAVHAAVRAAFDPAFLATTVAR